MVKPVLSQNVGTPDWQRGITTAQKLLATVPATTLTTTVGVPPNAETIVIVTSGPVGGNQVLTIKGSTSGQVYPWQVQFLTSGSQDYAQYYVDVTSVIDVELSITFTEAAAFTWYVYSDQAAHVVFDPNMGLLVQEHAVPPGLWGVLVEGFDGTDAQFIATDTSGKLVISNPGGGGTPQLVNAKLVDEGTLAIGSDGVDGRVISTDTNGRQIPLVPTLGVVAYSPSGTSNLLGVPPSGSWYLFGCEITNNDTAADYVTLSAGPMDIAQVWLAVKQTIEISLNGFSTQYSFNVTSGVANVVAYRYAPGP